LSSPLRQTSSRSARLRSREAGANSGEAGRRRAYIDWARGVAVLVMIEAHTLDAWTHLADRTTIAFRNATILGGFAAPMFLWLAGIGLVLSATRAAERSGSRAAGVDAGCRRGLEIFILAFLFRLQGFLITPGGSPLMILRVDILNVMGPSMVGAALLWGMARTASARVVLFTAAATAVAMTAPIVRTSGAIDLLPTWLQWYLRPAGELTTFTLFPWAAFVFAGAASGALIVEARAARSERTLHIVLASVAAILIAVGFYTAGRPSIYAAANFWTTSPTWFAIRLGILMLALAGLKACATVTATVAQPFRAANALRAAHVLERFGRASLFVYWIHVELVYGYASYFWWRRLPLWGTAVGYVAFCALMYLAIVARGRAVARWRAPRAISPRPAQKAII
jgi:uncharacterized membrane protein